MRIYRGYLRWKVDILYELNLSETGLNRILM